MIERPSLISALRHLDPDMLMTAIRDANLLPCQLSPRPMMSSTARLFCPRICIDFAALGPSLHIVGTTSPACYTLVFVTSCPTPGHSFNFGMEHTDGFIGFFPPGGMIDAMTPEGYANATLTIPSALFCAVQELHFPEMPAGMLRNGAALRIGNAEQQKLRMLLTDLENAIWQRDESLASESARQQIENELLASFMSALRSGCEKVRHTSGLRLTRRYERLRKAREYLAAHAAKPVATEDLCSHVGLHRRGLENLFHDLLDTSPATYHRHLRLHGARRTLREAAPGNGIVKRVALEWGFWHRGRFACDYYKLFGEYPAESL